ncbi:MAG: class I SAM-dependent methyltransferase [Planctomycetota bacterium]|jgi:SAM-dependent methyltransferase
MISAADEYRRAYTGSYDEMLRLGMQRSARAVVPRLVGDLSPGSVIDVGCGPGLWLAAFRELGVEDVLGVDGAHVGRDVLAIPPECFRAHDLREPLRLDRRFDLVLCLEVAEHLPGEAADTLVDSLAALGDTIVFSAAIPHQGGEQHVNEQWPDYWHERFVRRGYRADAGLREQVWNDPDVDWWYAQNLLVYTRAAARPPAACGSSGDGRGPLPLVHPRHYLQLREDTREAHRACRRARTQLLAQSIRSELPAGGRYILIGAEQLEPLRVDHRHEVVLTGPERAALRTQCDVTAAVERRYDGGPLFAVVAWPAFWMLDGPADADGPDLDWRTVLRNESCVILAARERRTSGSSGHGDLQRSS